MEETNCVSCLSFLKLHVPLSTVLFQQTRGKGHLLPASSHCILLQIDLAWDSIFQFVGPVTLCRSRATSRVFLKEVATDDARRSLASSITRKFSNLTLHDAAESGSLDVVWARIQLGAAVDEIDEHDCAPLHYASNNGYCQIASLLLAYGADVHKGYEGINIRSGWTPIHFAAYYGHVPVLLLLLSKNADPNSQDLGRRTPLHYARSLGRKKCIEILEVAGGCEDTHFAPKAVLEAPQWDATLSDAAQYNHSDADAWRGGLTDRAIESRILA